MTWREGKGWGLRVGHKGLAYLGSMVVVEFEGYGALREVSKIVFGRGKLAAPWLCLGRRW